MKSQVAFFFNISPRIIQKLQFASPLDYFASQTLTLCHVIQFYQEMGLTL